MVTAFLDSPGAAASHALSGAARAAPLAAAPEAAAATAQGGRPRPILYTLIETPKFSGLNPEAYLAYAIEQLARGHLASRLAELLPWKCKDAFAARTC